MRITSGIYGGRRIEAPKGPDVRPASDKVRQAVFNSLLSRIDLEGTYVLDGFCGSGSYGLEALSRGAAHCMFVDSARKSIETCRQNIETLNVQDKVHIISSDLLKLKNRIPDQVRDDGFNLVFLDPPYRKNLLLPAYEFLKERGFVTEKTLCVLECEKELDVPFGDSRTYGDVQIVFV